MNADDLVLGIIIEQRAEIMQLRAELAEFQGQAQRFERANDGEPTFDAAPDPAPKARKAKS